MRTGFRRLVSPRLFTVRASAHLLSHQQAEQMSAPRRSLSMLNHLLRSRGHLQMPMPLPLSRSELATNEELEH